MGRRSRRSRFGGDWPRFMALLQNRGECNLVGYRGSGKSGLGYAILRELLDRKIIDGVAANCGVDLPVHQWRDWITTEKGLRVPRGSYRCGYYFDEAGAVLDNRNFSQNPTQLARYLRKLRMVVIYMSATPIDKRFTALQVRPDTKFPGRWSYVWELTTADFKIAETGKLIWYSPAAEFGRWDTDAPVVDDAGLIELFEWTLAWRLQEWPREVGMFADASESNLSRIRA